MRNSRTAKRPVERELLRQERKQEATGGRTSEVTGRPLAFTLREAKPLKGFEQRSCDTV